MDRERRRRHGQQDRIERQGARQSGQVVAARDLDRRRDHFDRTMHRMDSKDPHNYDMVLDTNSLGFDIVSEIIVRAVEAGRPHQPERGQWSYSPPLKANAEPDSVPRQKPE